MKEAHWSVATACNILVRETLIGEAHWPVATDCTQHQTHPEVGCRRCDRLSACCEPTLLQLRLEDNPHRSVEVGGDGEEVGNVLPANRRTARPSGSTKTVKGGKISAAAGLCRHKITTCSHTSTTLITNPAERGDSHLDSLAPSFEDPGMNPAAFPCFGLIYDDSRQPIPAPGIVAIGTAVANSSRCAVPQQAPRLAGDFSCDCMFWGERGGGCTRQPVGPSVDTATMTTVLSTNHVDSRRFSSRSCAFRRTHTSTDPIRLLCIRYP